MITRYHQALDWLRDVLPPEHRETLYRVVAGVLTFLTGYGILDESEAALWAQLAVGTITVLFALLYSTTTLRMALYALIGPVGAVLMAYGIVTDQMWAVIVAAVGQVFGVATAGSKTVELTPLPTLHGVTTAVPRAVPRAGRTAIAVATPAEAAAMRRRRGNHAGHNADEVE